MKLSEAVGALMRGRSGVAVAVSVDGVRQLATESTLRGGRLLAPFAIRYIVVPVADEWLIRHRFVSTDWRAPNSTMAPPSSLN